MTPPVAWTAAGVAALLTIVGWAPPPLHGSGVGRAAAQATFRAGVEMVRVDALVVRDGVPVTGLTAADFELRDDGVVQTIVSASLEQIPLDVQFVLDMSGSVTEENARSLRAAARAFLAGLTPADRAGLLVFNARATALQPLTPDLGLVRAALEAIRGGGSTALHDAIYTALRLREPSANRGAIVVFTDGVDNISWLSRDEVLEAARRADVVVHPVLAVAPGARLNPADNPLLHGLTRDTGGQIWAASWGPALETSFRAVLDDLRSRYVLSYYPAGVPRSGWHALEVKLKRGGKVTARTGYYRPVAQK
jgi:VWFA-related protein